MPPIRSGSPRGISIFHNTCRGVIPTARPASIVDRLIASMPAYAPARIDGMARRTKATNAACSLKFTPITR